MKKRLFLTLTLLISYNCSGMSSIRNFARPLARYIRSVSQYLPSHESIKNGITSESKNLFKNTFSLIKDKDGYMALNELYIVPSSFLGTLKPLQETIKSTREITKNKNLTPQDWHNYHNPKKLAINTLKKTFFNKLIWRKIAYQGSKLALNSFYEKVFKKRLSPKAFRWIRPQMNFLHEVAWINKRQPIYSVAYIPTIMICNVIEYLLPYNTNDAKKIIYAQISRTLALSTIFSATATIAAYLNHRRISKKIENKIKNRQRIPLNYNNDKDVIGFLEKLKKKKNPQEQDKQYLAGYVKRYLNQKIPIYTLKHINLDKVNLRAKNRAIKKLAAIGIFDQSAQENKRLYFQ